MKSLTKPFTEKLKQLETLLANLNTNVKEAGEFLAKLIDEEPDTIDILITRNPGLNPGALITLEEVGRGRIHPLLVFSDGPAAKAAAALPPSQQKIAVENPLPVVHMEGSRVITEMKRLGEINARESSILFDLKQGRILSSDEQAKLITERQEQKTKRESVRYLIDDGFVQFYGSPKFSVSDLMEILARAMEISVAELESSIKKNQVK